MTVTVQNQATNTSATRTAASIAARVAALDWQAVGEHLDNDAYERIPALLTQDECGELAAVYPVDARFRNRVVMARHSYGRGEYKYFSYPLPRLVTRLRTLLYPPLAAIANRWNEELGVDTRYPDKHKAFVARCHSDGQTRPTPLMLRYGPGDYNCLHQDLYGEHVFPLQAVFLLSAPDNEFTGGEFILTEQRPRMQSRASVVPLCQGDAVIFPVRNRPVQGKRGIYRVNMRHGVSQVRSGHRQTLGIIFHDAK